MVKFSITTLADFISAIFNIILDIHLTGAHNGTNNYTTQRWYVI